MAQTLLERIDSRERTKDSITLHYTLRGTADDTTAYNLLLTSTPTAHQGMNRTDISANPVWVDTAAAGGAGDGEWDCSVRYALETPTKQENQSSWSFDMTGGSQHIIASKQTVGAYPPNVADVGDNGRLIGVTGDAVEGVDIMVPTFAWTETYCLSDATVNSKKATWYALTGKTNSASWKGFAEGEVLFQGCSGSKRGDGLWEVTFKFSASPNAMGLTIGDITGIAKKGWEYLWVRYKPCILPALNLMGKKPAAVYVEKVYDSGAFSGLGIGT